VAQVKEIRTFWNAISGYANSTA